MTVQNSQEQPGQESSVDSGGLNVADLFSDVEEGGEQVTTPDSPQDDQQDDQAPGQSDESQDNSQDDQPSGQPSGQPDSPQDDQPEDQPSGEPSEQPSDQPESTTPDSPAPDASETPEPGPSPQPEAQPSDIYSKPLDQFTQEEVDKVFRPARITQEDYNKILEGGEEGLQHLNDTIRKAVTNAVSVSTYMQERQKRALMQEMQPALSVAAEQQAERARTKFYGDYPHLKPYAKVVGKVAATLQPKTTDYKTVASTLATEVETMLKEMGIDPKKAKKTVAQKPISNTSVPNSRPQAMMKPRAGGSGVGQRQQESNPVKDIFT